MRAAGITGEANGKRLLAAAIAQVVEVIFPGGILHDPKTPAKISRIEFLQTTE